MLLALRSLFETETAVTPKRAGKKYPGPWRVPPFSLDAEAFLPSARFRATAGNITATGTATAILKSARSRFVFTMPQMSGEGTATITGARIKIRNAHEARHSSVILGANRIHPSDDDEALALILGTL